MTDVADRTKGGSFKPCYKWMTFNTKEDKAKLIARLKGVLNLVING